MQLAYSKEIDTGWQNYFRRIHVVIERSNHTYMLSKGASGTKPGDLYKMIIIYMEIPVKTSQKPKVRLLRRNWEKSSGPNLQALWREQLH